MYGGDDVGAVVIDVGTALTKTGFAGENVPKAVISTAVGCLPVTSDSSSASAPDAGDAEDTRMTDAPSVKQEASKKEIIAGHSTIRRRDHMEIVQPVQDGLVNDWDAIEALWRHSLVDVLHVDPREHPMLLVEPVVNTTDRRETMCELAFETFDTPAIFMAKDAVLSAFAVGRSTALIVNCGAGVTSTVAVHDGYALEQGMLRTKAAGNMLDTVLQEMLESKGHSIEPSYLFKRELSSEGKIRVSRLEVPHTTESFYRFRKQAIVTDIKHSVVRASDVPFDAESNISIPTMPYELPDGHLLEIGTERFMVAEELFKPAKLKIENDFDMYQFEGIPEMVRSTIDSSDVDIRRDLYSNIVVSGGTSAIRGMGERLYKELMATAAPAFKVKILSVSSHTERMYGPWIGGSILGSLGSFQQMWLSRAEYDEHGKSIITSKCP